MDGRSDVTAFVDKCKDVLLMYLSLNTDSNVDNQYGDCEKNVSIKVYHKTNRIFDLNRMLKEVEKEPSTDDLSMEIILFSEMDSVSVKKQLSHDTMFTDFYMEDEKVDVLHVIEELKRHLYVHCPFKTGIVVLKMLCANAFPKDFGSRTKKRNKTDDKEKFLLKTFYTIKKFGSKKM